MDDYRVKPQGRTHTSQLSKRLYNIKEAAVYLGRTEWAVRGMIFAGKLSCVKDGRRVLLDIRDMDAWIERSKTQFDG
jgi:excisionase family DNA binding protein